MNLRLLKLADLLLETPTAKYMDVNKDDEEIVVEEPWRCRCEFLSESAAVGSEPCSRRMSKTTHFFGIFGECIVMFSAGTTCYKRQPVWVGRYQVE